MNNQAIPVQVIQILRQNNFEQWAEKLERLIVQISDASQQVRSNAADEIEGLCHIRSLGDLNIQSMNGWEWNKKLEKLKKYAKKKAKS